MCPFTRIQYSGGDFCLFCQVLEECMANTVCRETLFPTVARRWNTLKLLGPKFFLESFPHDCPLPPSSGILIQRHFRLGPPYPHFPEAQVQDDSLVPTISFHFHFSHTASEFKMQPAVAFLVFFSHRFNLLEKDWESIFLHTVITNLLDLFKLSKTKKGFITYSRG